MSLLTWDFSRAAVSRNFGNLRLLPVLTSQSSLPASIKRLFACSQISAALMMLASKVGGVEARASDRWFGAIAVASTML